MDNTLEWVCGEVIAQFAREAVCMVEHRDWLDAMRYDVNLEGVSRRLLDIIDVAYPWMIMGWMGERQARIDRAIAEASRRDDAPPF